MDAHGGLLYSLLCHLGVGDCSRVLMATLKQVLSELEIKFGQVPINILSFSNRPLVKLMLESRKMLKCG